MFNSQRLTIQVIVTNSSFGFSIFLQISLSSFYYSFFIMSHAFLSYIHLTFFIFTVPKLSSLSISSIPVTSMYTCSIWTPDSSTTCMQMIARSPSGMGSRSCLIPTFACCPSAKRFAVVAKCQCRLGSLWDQLVHLSFDISSLE